MRQVLLPLLAVLLVACAGSGDNSSPDFAGVDFSPRPNIDASTVSDLAELGDLSTIDFRKPLPGDMGRTIQWTFEKTDSMGIFVGLCAMSATDIVALNSLGELWRSTGNGVWTQGAKAAQVASSMWCSPSTSEMWVNDEADVFYSGDDGKTWAAVTHAMGFKYIDPKLRLHQVGGTSPSSIYAVGDGGYVATNAPNGFLHNCSSGTTAALYAIAGFSDTEIYVVGEKGTILRSMDRGASWQPLNSGVMNDLWSVWTSGKFGPLTLWAGGDGGVLLHSPDHGVTWVQDNSGVTGRLAAHTRSFDDIEVVVGWDGAAIFSGDAVSWLNISFPATYDLASATSSPMDIFLGGLDVSQKPANGPIIMLHGK